MPRPNVRRDLCTKLVAICDERIAELEPIVAQPLGSKEQRLALIELAYVKVLRERAAKRLRIAIEGLKPSK